MEELSSFITEDYGMKKLAKGNDDEETDRRACSVSVGWPGCTVTGWHPVVSSAPTGNQAKSQFAVQHGIFNGRFATNYLTELLLYRRFENKFVLIRLQDNYLAINWRHINYQNIIHVIKKGSQKYTHFYLRKWTLIRKWVYSDGLRCYLLHSIKVENWTVGSEKQSI